MQSVTTPASTSAVAIRYGCLTGLVSIIFTFILFASGQITNTALQFAGIIIPIAGIYLAHQAFKKQNAGHMSYGEGLGIGTLLSVVSGILSTAFGFLYKTVIDPDFQNKIMETTRAKLEAAGNMSDAQIDQAMSMSTKLSSGPISIVIGLVGSVLVGLLISLVVAAITKNTKPEFE